MAESGAMRLVHIAGLGFDREIIMQPLVQYGCDRLYLVAQIASEARESRRDIVADFYKSIASGIEVNHIVCPPVLESIYAGLEDVVDRELRDRASVYLNLSSGSRLFAAAAAIVAHQRDVELYYVKQANYHVERSFITGVEQVMHLPALRQEISAVNVDSSLCFVVMPFAEALQPVFEEVIKPVAAELDLRCIRADDFFDNRPIMDDIWENIEKARMVVADLTGRNPNVFYETGIAHAMGKEVVLLAQSLEDVPFDLRHLRCIIYSDNIKGTHKLAVDLRRTLEKVIERTRTPNTSAAPDVNRALRGRRR